MNVRALIGYVFLGSLALAAATAAIQSLRLDAAQKVLAAHVACAEALAGKPDASPVEAVCEPAVAAAHREADRARACEAALTSGDLLALERACPTSVKRLDGQVRVDAHTIESLRGQLAQASETQTQAVVRAEARGRTQAERDARAEAVRQLAPRDGDGLRVYDAGRLCERFETQPCA